MKVALPNAVAVGIDVFGPMGAPLASGGEFDRWNIAGIKSVVQLPADVRDLLVNGPEPERSGPEAPGRPTAMREPPPAPVMGE